MKNWKEALIHPTESVRDCLRKIDKAALKIGFVCDELGIIVGTISDGDIRRAIIGDISLEDTIENVFNRKPKVASENTARSELLKVLEENEIEAIPIIDAHGRIKTVETISTLRSPVKRDNPIFIMAGGFGTRLRPLTNNCPKPMLPIAGKPMLEHIINNFIAKGFWNFYISVHYLPEVITEYFSDGSALGVRIQYVTENTPLGTGGALGLLPENMNKLPLVLINGDIYTDLDVNSLIEYHEESEADATMCLRAIENSIAYGVVEKKGRYVTRMIEKPTYRHLINTGIYVISNACVSAVEKNKKIDLPTLLQNRMNENRKIAAYEFYGKWIDIGRIDDYARAEQEARKFED